MTALLLILSSCLLLSLFYILLLHSQIKGKDRAYERLRVLYVGRETELVDRIMHLSGNTWTLPPRENLKPEEEILDPELQRQLEGWREV